MHGDEGHFVVGAGLAKLFAQPGDLLSALGIVVGGLVVPGIEYGIEDDDTKFCIGAEGIGGIAAEFLVKAGRDSCRADSGPGRYGIGVILEERGGELAVIAIGGVVVAGYEEEGNVGFCCDVSEIGECFAGVSHGADDGVCDGVAGQVAEVDDEAGFFRG